MQFQLSMITIYLVDILSSSNVTKGFPEQSLDRLSSHICSANTLVDVDTQAIKGYQGETNGTVSLQKRTKLNHLHLGEMEMETGVKH